VLLDYKTFNKLKEMLEMSTAKDELIRDLNQKIESETQLLNTALSRYKSHSDDAEDALNETHIRQDKIQSLYSIKLHLERYGVKVD
jgi:hypothetical protein